MIYNPQIGIIIPDTKYAPIHEPRTSHAYTRPAAGATEEEALNLFAYIVIIGKIIPSINPLPKSTIGTIQDIEMGVA